MEFWTQETRYGLFHQADKSNKKYRSDILVVFVHGIFGNPAETWSETPQWLSERIGSNVNILNFSYAAGLWQKASIPLASSDLQTCLETTYSDYNFFIFITHSTGGLVVKHVLNESFDGIRKDIDNQQFSFADSSSLWFKTRRVVNIAVPHNGGDPSFTKIGQIAYKYVYLLAKPFLKLIRTMTQGAADVGKNEIIDSLRYNNPWLAELHENSEKALQYSINNHLLHPSSFDILAGSDIAVPTSSAAGQQVTFRGNHDSVKIPDHPSGPIMDILTTQVSDFSGSNYYLVLHAYEITRKLDALNQALGTNKLIGSSDDGDENSGSQQQVFDGLYARLNSTNKFSRQLLLTGGGGSGKSTVMRNLLMQLSFDYIMNPDPQQVIPLSIPLQMMSGQEINADLSWATIWQWHERWVNELFPTSNFHSTKLISCFNTQACCILFDGLDEFLALHNEVSSSHMLNIFKGAIKQYRNNPKFSILTVCRSSLPGIEKFTHTDNDIYEVAGMTVDQATKNFPLCSKWLQYVEDQDLLDVVLTPLILSSLDEMPGINGTPLNATHIIGQSIESILRQSNLEDTHLSDGTQVTREHLLIALMLIAWTFFKNVLGEVSLNRLRSEAKVIANEWSEYLSTHNLDGENDQLKASLSLLNDDTFISNLTQRTLFITTGHLKVRFSNRQWQDYLIALYFKQCLTLGNVDDFGETAFNPVIYRMAGELMSEEIITETMAERALSRWQETGKSSIVGDILAFISWTTVAIEPAAVRLFLSEAGNYSEITRIVLIAGFGYRGMGSVDNDPSANDIRAALIPLLKVMSDCDMCPIGDRVASSIAWCYLRVYADKFNIEIPNLPWPELRFNEEGQKIALNAMCNEINGKFQLNKYTKSLQIAFLAAIKQAQKNPLLLIRSMHYLYFLVMAKKFGAHVIELNAGIDELLVEQSELANMLKENSPLPELNLMFEHFQELQKNS